MEGIEVSGIFEIDQCRDVCLLGLLLSWGPVFSWCLHIRAFAEESRKPLRLQDLLLLPNLLIVEVGCPQSHKTNHTCPSVAGYDVGSSSCLQLLSNGSCWTFSSSNWVGRCSNQ